jgi:hypothetical protein
LKPLCALRFVKSAKTTKWKKENALGPRASSLEEAVLVLRAGAGRFE